MNVMSRRTSSSLNPNAPLFVPRAYRAVEDFSDQWWELVESTAWFRDYWLQEWFQEPQNNLDFHQNDEPFLPDIEAVFEGYGKREENEGDDFYRELVSLGAFKLHKSRGLEDGRRYAEKAPKVVNVKMTPRPIQQPR